MDRLNLNDYTLAKMKVENRTDLISDDQAIEFLLNFINKKNISEFHYNEAKFYMAQMRAYRHTRIIDDNQAFYAFCSIHNNRAFSLKDQTEAKFFMAAMHFFNRVDLLTIDQTINFFKNVIYENNQASKDLRIAAEKFLLKMASYFPIRAA